MFQKSLKQENRAKKYPFKYFLLGAFVIFGFIFTNEIILADTIIEDDFEEYETGHSLNEYPKWNYNTTDDWIVLTDEECPEGDNCAISTLETEYARASSTTQFATGTIGFHFSFEAGNSVYLNKDTDGNQLTHLRFFGNGDIKLYIQGPTYETLFNVATNTWHWLKIEWDAPNQKARVSLNGSDWTAWKTTAYTRDYLNYINFFRSAETGYFAIDYIWEDPEIACNKNWCGLCQTYLTCETAGCCWYYSTWLYQNFCISCPIGECASGPFDCQNCVAQETCEAQEYCYWYNGICKYGTGQCNEGLELQFCDNQGDCETAGGYWYSNYCWLSEKPSLLNWIDYYSEHGDYEEPSAWISGVASSTTEFFDTIGGFLATFKETFDTKEAYEKGKDFGLALPVARGYLGILDDFLGGLPISEFFIFILIFMIAVGVFRIVRNIFQILKFW